MRINKVATLAIAGSLLFSVAACADDEDAIEGFRKGLEEQGYDEETTDCIVDYVDGEVEDLVEAVEDNSPELTEALQTGLVECTGSGEEETTEEEEPAEEEVVEEEE
jgi:hypothetical protein